MLSTCCPLLTPNIICLKLRWFKRDNDVVNVKIAENIAATLFNPTIAKNDVETVDNDEETAKEGAKTVEDDVETTENEVRATKQRCINCQK